jgi:hypothetical protein
MFGDFVRTVKTQNIVKSYLKLLSIFGSYQREWENVCKKNICKASITGIDADRFLIRLLGEKVYVNCRCITVGDDADFLIGKVIFRYGEIRLLETYFNDNGKAIASLKQFASDKPFVDENNIDQVLCGLVDALIEQKVFPTDCEA